MSYDNGLQNRGTKARYRYVVVVDLTPKQKKNKELLQLIEGFVTAGTIKAISDDGPLGTPDRIVIEPPISLTSSLWAPQIAEKLKSAGLAARSFDAGPGYDPKYVQSREWVQHDRNSVSKKKKVQDAPS